MTTANSNTRHYWTSMTPKVKNNGEVCKTVFEDEETGCEASIDVTRDGAIFVNLRFGLANDPNSRRVGLSFDKNASLLGIGHGATIDAATTATFAAEGEIK